MQVIIITTYFTSYTLTFTLTFPQFQLSITSLFRSAFQLTFESLLPQYLTLHPCWPGDPELPSPPPPPSILNSSLNYCGSSGGLTMISHTRASSDTDMLSVVIQTPTISRMPHCHFFHPQWVWLERVALALLPPQGAWFGGLE